MVDLKTKKALVEAAGKALHECAIAGMVFTLTDTGMGQKITFEDYKIKPGELVHLGEFRYLNLAGNIIGEIATNSHVFGDEDDYIEINGKRYHTEKTDETEK